MGAIIDELESMTEEEIMAKYPYRKYPSPETFKDSANQVIVPKYTEPQKGDSAGTGLERLYREQGSI